MTYRAVVLAAGRGTRLGALAAATPKPLLEVGGIPIIERILRGIAAQGVYEVAVITGHMADAVEERVWGMAGLSIEFIRQAEPAGTAAAIALARDFTRDQRFFFTWGDVLVHPANYTAVLGAGGWADAIIAVNEVEDPAAGAAVYVDDDFGVHRIEEKPPRGTAGTKWNNAGFGVLGPTIWDHLAGLGRSPRGELELTDALVALIDARAKVLAVPVWGAWFDVGTPASLAAARVHYESD